jgi:Vitamin K-dependent gamma-carboxylase
VIRRLLHWANAEGPLICLGVFRAFAGFMVIRDAWEYLGKYVIRGFYQNEFYVPYAPWYPLPSEPFYVAILLTLVLAGSCMIVGVVTRPAVTIAFLLHTFHLFLNQMWYRHNRYFLVLCLMLLAFSPCNRAFALQRRKGAPWGPLWTTYLVRIQLSLIYFASATSKTLDPDWSSGRVLYDIGLAGGWDAVAPPWLQGIVPRRTLVEWITLSALFQEFFLGLCLWHPLTRRVAMWVGIMFHGYIEVRYSVLTFSYLVLGSYFLIVRPERGNRTLHIPAQSRLGEWSATAVSYLDWLDKFRIERHGGSKVFVTDFDGRCYSGWFALVIAGTALPLMFFFVFPLSLVRLITRRYDGIGPEGELMEKQAFLLPPSHSAGMLVVLVAAYVGMLIATAVLADFSSAPDDTRFLDIPIFTLMLLLLHLSWRRSARPVDQ